MKSCQSAEKKHSSTSLEELESALQPSQINSTSIIFLNHIEHFTNFKQQFQNLDEWEKMRFQYQSRNVNSNFMLLCSSSLSDVITSLPLSSIAIDTLNGTQPARAWVSNDKSKPSFSAKTFLQKETISNEDSPHHFDVSTFQIPTTSRPHFYQLTQPRVDLTSTNKLNHESTSLLPTNSTTSRPHFYQQSQPRVDLTSTNNPNHESTSLQPTIPTTSRPHFYQQSQPRVDLTSTNNPNHESTSLQPTIPTTSRPHFYQQSNTSL